jgi:hypothetical protein
VNWGKPWYRLIEVADKLSKIRTAFQSMSGEINCNSKGVSQRHFTLRISEFLDFVHRLLFWKNTIFRKLDVFPSWGERVGDTYSAASVRKSWSQSLGPLVFFQNTRRWKRCRKSATPNEYKFDLHWCSVTIAFSKDEIIFLKKASAYKEKKKGKSMYT